MSKKATEFQRKAMSWMYRGKEIFKPLNTGWIDENVACVREWVANIFFYRKGDTTIMIDAGYNYDRLAEKMGWLGIDPSSIRHILITHQDTDHVGAVEADSPGLFQNAKLYIGEIENRYLTGEAHRKVIYRLYKLPQVTMPFGMWVLFAGSFQKQLTAVLGYDAATARAITKKAKPQYRQIIRRLPEFEKADRFKMNLINCAMIGAFILSMPQRPEVDRLTDYYAKSMMTKPMQWFCRKSGKSKFTPKDIAAMKATAALKAADRNPYSWNMEFYEYPDGSGYEGRFTKCGICVLMKELGLYDLTPALCRLDYTMSEAGAATNFVRQYTLASGGPYCDCGYKKKG